MPASSGVLHLTVPGTVRHRLLQAHRSSLSTSSHCATPCKISSCGKRRRPGSLHQSRYGVDWGGRGSRGITPTPVHAAQMAHEGHRQEINIGISSRLSGGSIGKPRRRGSGRGLMTLPPPQPPQEKGTGASEETATRADTHRERAHVKNLRSDRRYRAGHDD